ncbi:MAG TPA: outer membrane protein assembly factor BamB [Gammaproteobacteria bacterium]|nr:outer membrane protein assembly factor BamB [Gammaproteobacteria bacterium]
MNNLVVKGFGCALVFLMMTGITGCNHSPIRNPFKSQKIVLGPLPPLEEQTTAEIVWRQRTTKGAGDFAKIRPTLENNTIYQADHSGILVAINKANGRKFWRKITKHPIASGPVLIQNNLYVGTKNGKVVAFNPQSGEELWQARVPSEVLAPPQGNQEVILVNTIDGQLTALAADSGKILWSYQRVIPSLTLRGGSSPALAHDQALAGFANGKLVALEVKTGSMAWERTITVPRGRSELHRMVDMNSNPIIVGDTVFVASYHGNVAGIDINSGQVKWQHQLSSYRDMEADDKALYVTDNEHHVWALDLETGGTLWKQAALSQRKITGPALTDDYLVVGDHGGYVHWLRKSDGQLLGRYGIGKQILERPVAQGNLVLVTAVYGEMTALRLPSMAENRSS